MNPDARHENIRALMAAANIPEEEAAARLQQCVLLTFDKSDDTSCRLVKELLPVLSKTLHVDLIAQEKVVYATELVIGKAQGITRVKRVYSVIRSDELIVSQSAILAPNQTPSYPLLILISACYLAGAVIGSAIGEGIPNLPPPEFSIPFEVLARLDYSLLDTVDIGEAYLAGAGAVGNGFIWAARHASLKGKLHVADGDKVSSGNLQRQIWFQEKDIGHNKAEVLCARAQKYLPECALVPAVCRLQEHPNANDGPWLSKLIVGVDSRRARRHLQNLLPGKVFDASTTGSEEIILHRNQQPTDLACMGCIYYHDQQETTQDQAIAEQLGISVSDVQKQIITPEIAQRICQRNSGLNAGAITGEAFDSLYKALCGSQKLRSISGKQIIAPFAFVSVLAGALLLLEIIRKQTKDFSDHSNLWRLSPWHPPIVELRQTRPRRPNCECCSRNEIRTLQEQFWRNVG